MPQQRITGHERQAMAGELRHRMEGGEPVLYPELSYKQLKERLRSAKAQPVLHSSGPKEKPDDI